MPGTPCGKCNSCPCPSGQQPAQVQQPNQQRIEPQMPETSAGIPPQPRKTPKTECLCTSRRNQQPTTVQAPLADTYTCSRPRPEAVRQHTPMEERCTCRPKPVPATCECEPDPQPPISQVHRHVEQPQPRQPPTNEHVTCGQPQQPSTNEHITCGQPIPRQSPRNYYTPAPQAPGSCGHCRSQRKKKCNIQ